MARKKSHPFNCSCKSCKRKRSIGRAEAAKRRKTEQMNARRASRGKLVPVTGDAFAELDPPNTPSARLLERNVSRMISEGASEHEIGSMIMGHHRKYHTGPFRRENPKRDGGYFGKELVALVEKSMPWGYCTDDENDRNNLAIAIAAYLLAKKDKTMAALQDDRGVPGRRQNPSTPARPMYSYGMVPDVATLEASVGPAGFWYLLRGSDARTATRAGIPTFVDMHHAIFGRELHEILTKLTRAWESGDEQAGDLASSFLYAIGIEWI